MTEEQQGEGRKTSTSGRERKIRAALVLDGLSAPARVRDWAAYSVQHREAWAAAIRQVDGVTEEGARVHPAPLVPMRPAVEAELPSAARTVRALAEANGWLVRPTYALGWTPHSNRSPSKLVHSVALRMRRGDSVAVALWAVPEVTLGTESMPPVPPATGWKFKLAYAWGAGHPITKLSASALKETIKGA